jgi:hypothetical protein
MNVVDRMVDYATRPVPLRALVLRKFLSRWPLGSYGTRVRAGAVARPPYAWCAYQAAMEAKALGYSAVTVVEVGVAKGGGLLCLCDHSQEIRKELGVEVVVVGFDSGEGLPATNDPRDVNYFWRSGAYKMDRQGLEKQLAGRAKLILGDVSRTTPAWSPRADAPLGAVMFDLDLYTSTCASFGLLTNENALPRIWCYFDDVAGSAQNALTERIGEREAIRHFNLMPDREFLHDHLSPAFTFKGMAPEYWHPHIYLYHRFSHPSYNTYLISVPGR